MPFAVLTADQDTTLESRMGGEPLSETFATFDARARVSVGQEVESQKLGLREYANRHGFAPMELIAETVSRSADWRRPSAQRAA
ncbi:MAG: hypothetical protein ABS69_00150 [Nitrosomonadales bacterium SCN 54-20]|nr:MAG: hypothetical protein ABS69_00150 [Nitrosomonadales bacterium SCN 54-20]